VTVGVRVAVGVAVRVGVGVTVATTLGFHPTSFSAARVSVMS
jgi:hypothetical protein